MDAVSYSTARNNLKSFMKKVNDDAEGVIITSKNPNENSVLLSQAEYDNLIENAYIRSSEANISHIMKSWQQIRDGEGREHDWQ